MSNWENEEKLSIRTKIGLRVLLLIFTVVAPYQFGKVFESEINELKELIRDATASEK